MAETRKETILIVDDSTTQVTILKQTFVSRGYNVLTAKNGVEAVEIATASQPDIILLDIVMPVKDGFSACKELKADERTKQIPIIFTTSLSETSNVIKGLELGAVDYIPKPFKAPEVLARTTTHLTLRRLQKELEATNASLEEKVKERTSELQESNESLKKEIEERKRAEKAAQDSEIRFRNLAQNSPDTIYIFNPQSKAVTYINKESFLGYKSSSVFSNKFYLNVHHEDREVATHHFENIMKYADEILEFRMRNTDGKWEWIQSRARLLETPSSPTDVPPYLVTLSLITERKEAEEKLLEAKELAERSDKLKTSFLTQMSHEVRSPINAIFSFSTMLKAQFDIEDDEELQSSLAIITRGGKRLLRTFELMLDMSQLQSETYQLTPETFDIKAELLEEILEKYTKVAESKYIELQLKDMPAECKIHTDQYSLRQILDNVINNAVTYTFKGGVDISFFKNGNKQLIAEISDTGIGMSEEYLEHIYEPFSQEDQGLTRSFEGNGLGMALVKKFCDINNIKIEIVSELKKGSTVRLRFPINNN